VVVDEDTQECNCKVAVPERLKPCRIVALRGAAEAALFQGKIKIQSKIKI